MPHNKILKLSLPYCKFRRQREKNWNFFQISALIIRKQNLVPTKRITANEARNDVFFPLEVSVFFTSTIRSSGNGVSPPSSLLISCHFSSTPYSPPPQPSSPSSNYKQTDPFRRTGETFDSLHKIKDEAAIIVYSSKRMFSPKKYFQRHF